MKTSMIIILTCFFISDPSFASKDVIRIDKLTNSSSTTQEEDLIKLFLSNKLDSKNIIELQDLLRDSKSITLNNEYLDLNQLEFEIASSMLPGNGGGDI